MKNYLKILCILFFIPSLCYAASPYLTLKRVYQNDRGSDWVLSPERDWINGSNNPRLHIHVGLAWDRNISCFGATGTDYLEWVHVGCSKDWGSYNPDRRFNFFGQLAIIHQIDSLTDPILSTDMKAWQGHNPFWHFRFGMKWKHKIRCPVFATGRSLFQGNPFESEDMAPDLYWFHIECSKSWGGK